MTVDLLEARQSILNIVPLLKEGKFIEAIGSLSSGLEVVLRTNAPDKVKVAFAGLLGKAMLVLSSSPAYKRLQIRPISYEHGQERRLYQQLKLLEKLISQHNGAAPRPAPAQAPAGTPAAAPVAVAPAQAAPAQPAPSVGGAAPAVSPKTANLTLAKQKIMGIVPMLKEGRLIEAIASLSVGMETILRAQLPKEVTVSFTELLGKAIIFLTSSPAYKEMRISPLAYEQGQEKRLYLQLKGLEKQILSFQEERKRQEKARQEAERRRQAAAKLIAANRRLLAAPALLQENRPADAAAVIAEALEVWFRSKPSKELAEPFLDALAKAARGLDDVAVRELPGNSRLCCEPGQEKQLYNGVKNLEKQLVALQSQKERQAQAAAMEALGQAKQNLLNIGSFLKEGKIKECAAILAESVEQIQTLKLMKAERDRFAAMIDNAVLRVSCSREFKRLNTTPLYYDRGQEKQLYLQLKTLEKEADRFNQSGPAAPGDAARPGPTKGPSGVPRPSDQASAKQLMINIGPLLKDGKLVEAIQSLMAGMDFFQGVRMTKAERDGFADLLDKSIQRLTIAPEYRKLGLTPVKYLRGQERQLSMQLSMLEEEILLVIRQHDQQEKAVNSEKLQKTLQKGFEMLDNKELKRGAALLRNLVTDKATPTEALTEIAKRFLGMKEPMYALDFLEAALKRSPDDVSLNAMAGEAFQKTGKMDRAEAHYLKCQELGGATGEMFLSLGWLYLNARLVDKAYEAAKQALQLDPGNEEAQKLFRSAEKKIFG